MRRHGRARVSVDDPEAFAVCDGCGFTYNHANLGFDYQWAGQRLNTKRMLKCETCRDLPNDQLFAVKLPPDPALFDRSDAIAVLEEILPTLPLVHYRNLWDPALILKEILSAISRAKDELYDDKGYLALAKKMEEDAGDDEEKQFAAQSSQDRGNIDKKQKAQRLASSS